MLFLFGLNMSAGQLSSGTHRKVDEMNNVVKPQQLRQNWNTLCIGCYEQDVKDVLVRDQGVLYQVGSSFVLQDPFGLSKEAFLNSPISAGYDIHTVRIDDLVIFNDGYCQYVDISQLAHITNRRTAVFVIPSAREPLKNELFYCGIFSMISSQLSWYKRQIYIPFTLFVTEDMDTNILNIIANYMWFFQKFRMAYVAMFSTFRKMRSRIGNGNEVLLHNAESIAYFNKTEESETTMLLEFAVPYIFCNGHRIVKRQYGIPLEEIAKMKSN